MRRYAVILINLIVVVGYSAFFILINGPFGEQTFLHLYVLLAHLVLLCAAGIWILWEKERWARMFLVSLMLVTVLGGGLWFLNAMAHMH